MTIYKDDGKSYDRFRGRVMFPVYSVSGKVLGFSGRILSSEKQAAKYVNSPESEIYNKSRTLYGIYQAKGAISKNDLCYLVEGNIDVITLHQAGVENTVASSGTSLTTEQIRLIHRYTKNITVLYDGDPAGIKAALRAVNMLLEEGMNVRVVLFPDGEDPDSYTRKYGSEAIQNYVTTQATNFIVFKTKILLEDTKGDPIKKAELIKDIVETIALVPEIIERNIYVKECASILDVSEQTLATELAKRIYNNRKKQGEKELTQQTIDNTPTPNTAEDTTPQTSTPVVDMEKVKRDLLDSMYSKTEIPQEQKIISLLLNYGDVVMKGNVVDEDGNMQEEEYYVATQIVGDILNDELGFENPIYQEIFDIYKNKILEGEIINSSYFFDLNREDITNMVATMMVNPYNISNNWFTKYQIYVPSYQENLEKDIKQGLLRFKQLKLEDKIKALSEELKHNPSDDDMMITLYKIESLKKIKQMICKELSQIITG